MSDTSSRRSGVAVLLVVLILSAATMLYLVWHFPLITGLVTLGVLTALGISARLARSIEAERTDLDRHEQHV